MIPTYPRHRVYFAAVILLISTAPAASRAADNALAPAARLELTLQSRDADGKVATRTEAVDPRKVGVVLVDTWNFHWCMTATQRCGSFVPRFNRATAGARKL